MINHIQYHWKEEFMLGALDPSRSFIACCIFASLSCNVFFGGVISLSA